jgi:hypothetical protein
MLRSLRPRPGSQVPIRINLQRRRRTMSQPKLIGAALALAVAAGTLIYVQAQGSQTTSQGSQMKAQGGQSKAKGSQTQSKAKTTGGRHQFVGVHHSNCGLIDPTQDTITLHKGLQDDVSWFLDVSAPKGHKVKVKFQQGPCDQGNVFTVTKDSPSAFCTIENAQTRKTYKYRVFDKDDQPCGLDPSVDVQP